MWWLDEKATAGRAILYVTLGTMVAEHVQGRGQVVREWVDQRAIIAHKCIKGFLSHDGVPLAVWPMGAEQPLNAKLVVDELIRVPMESDADSRMVRSKHIARVTSDLMIGDTGAEVVRKMAASAAKAREAMAKARSSCRAMEELFSVFSRQSAQP
ncbi:UDP-glycosyltransferase 90A1-like [Miscanthus floridulus]|uniref:UDP-glycosyltransferase 90A1-like n=1 Tax=Miscanthus floridulus TaxID=154761 RepID=UPI00345B01BF